jgi:hypothetical protein
VRIVEVKGRKHWGSKKWLEHFTTYEVFPKTHLLNSVSHVGPFLILHANGFVAKQLKMGF